MSNFVTGMIAEAVLMLVCMVGSYVGDRDKAVKAVHSRYEALGVGIEVTTVEINGEKAATDKLVFSSKNKWKEFSRERECDK